MPVKGRVIDPDDEVDDEDQKQEADGKEPIDPADDDGSYTEGEEGEAPEEAPAESNVEPGAPGGDEEPEGDEVPADGDDSEEPVDGEGTEDEDEDEEPRRPPVKGRVLPLTEKSVTAPTTENKDEVTIVDSDVLFEMIGEGLNKAVEPINALLSKLNDLLGEQYKSLSKAINEQAEVLDILNKSNETISKSLDELKTAEPIVKAVADESAKTDPAPKSAEPAEAAGEVLNKAVGDDTNIYVTTPVGDIFRKATELQNLTGNAILSYKDTLAVNDGLLTKARLAAINNEVEKISKSLGV